MAEKRDLTPRRESRGVSRAEDFWPRDFFSVNPFAMMRRMGEQMERAFESFGGWSPAVEVGEKEGSLTVCAELPGVSPEDVKVEVTNEGLVLHGEKKSEHKEEHEGFYRSERSYGSFHRVIPLPEGAELEKADARFKDGVLEVKIPLPQSQKKGREIPIRT
jgi:HSP20 family protein